MAVPDGTERRNWFLTALILTPLLPPASARGTELSDQPKDEQSQIGEDLIAPLAGALKLEFPAGSTPPPALRQVPVSRLL